jgi:hypothetical protein
MGITDDLAVELGKLATTLTKPRLRIVRDVLAPDGIVIQQIFRGSVEITTDHTTNK